MLVLWDPPRALLMEHHSTFIRPRPPTGASPNTLGALNCSDLDLATRLQRQETGNTVPPGDWPGHGLMHSDLWARDRGQEISPPSAFRPPSLQGEITFATVGKTEAQGQ